MIRAGTGISELRESVKAAREAASRALAAAAIERADALFVFATTDHAPRFGLILAALEEIAPRNAIAGCGASGVLTETREVESGPAVAVLAAEGPGLSVEAGLLPEAPPAHDLGLALGHLARVAPFAPRPGAAHPPLIVIFPAPRSFDAADFFAGLESSVGFLPVVGGAPSGRDGRFFQFAGGQAVEDRTATALFRAGTHVEVAVAQGCRPIGRPAVVTKVGAGGAILALASRPAIETLAGAIEDAGIGEAEAAASSIFAGIAIDPRKHPLGRGDFLVRPIVGIDSDTGAIAIGDRVSVGQTLVFQLRDRRTATDDLEATLAELAGRLEGRTPRFALYFDCLGRGRGLYGEPDHDVSRIRARFPDLPVAGFFGSGEIAPVAGKNHVHSYTGVLAVFCEP